MNELQDILREIKKTPYQVVDFLEQHGPRCLHEVLRPEAREMDRALPWSMTTEAIKGSRSGLLFRFLELVKKEMERCQPYASYVSKEDIAEHERCLSGEFGEVEMRKDPSVFNFVPSRLCVRCNRLFAEREKAILAKGEKKRRYCWMCGCAVVLADDEKCIECCQPGSKHRVIEDQTRCGNYVPTDDSHGVGCVLEANHMGPHSNGGTPYVAPKWC